MDRINKASDEADQLSKLTSYQGWLHVNTTQATHPNLGLLTTFRSWATIYSAVNHSDKTLAAVYVFDKWTMYMKVVACLIGWGDFTFLWIMLVQPTRTNTCWVGELSQCNKKYLISYVSFLITDTNFAPDQMISRITQAFARSDVFNTQDLGEIVKQYVHVVINDGEKVRPWRDSLGKYSARQVYENFMISCSYIIQATTWWWQFAALATLKTLVSMSKEGTVLRIMSSLQIPRAVWGKLMIWVQDCPSLPNEQWLYSKRETSTHRVATMTSHVTCIIILINNNDRGHWCISPSPSFPLRVVRAQCTCRTSMLGVQMLHVALEIKSLGINAIQRSMRDENRHRTATKTSHMLSSWTYCQQHLRVQTRHFLGRV